MELFYQIIYFSSCLWELVVLVHFYSLVFYEKQSAGDAAKKASNNRIGDIGMFLGIMLLFVHAPFF